MTDEFDFFSNDINNWNYNPYINTPNIDPYNNKRTINITSNNSYNLMKYNCVIMLYKILKHTNQYLDDDVEAIEREVSRMRIGLSVLEFCS